MAVEPPVGFSPAALHHHRLVSGEEHDARAFQLALDAGTLVGVARDARDRLADHVVEATIRSARLSEEVLNPAVPLDRNVERLMRSLRTADGNILAPGINVVEAGDDPSTGRKALAAHAVLPRYRERRVLLILRRAARSESPSGQDRHTLRLGEALPGGPCLGMDGNHQVILLGTRTGRRAVRPDAPREGMDC